MRRILSPFGILSDLPPLSFWVLAENLIVQHKDPSTPLRFAQDDIMGAASAHGSSLYKHY
jgi:hypothetical protein